MNKLTSGGKPPVTYGSAVVLGKQGEYGYDFEYDFTDWVEEHGAGSVGWTIKRPTDASAYLLPHTEDGNVTSITITETELQYAGHGKLEVFYVNDGETQKRISVTFTTVVFDSVMDIGEVPEPWESYVDAVHADAVAAEEARQAIEDMTATASVDDSFGVPSVEVTKSLIDEHVNLDFDFVNLKGNGITGAELNADYTLTLEFNEGSYTTPSIRGEKGEQGEKGNVMYAVFDIDPATGILSMTYDSEYSGANFALTNDGYLEVII